MSPRSWRVEDVNNPFKIQTTGNSLVVQWLGLSALTAMGLGLIPGQGTKIPQASSVAKKKKKKIHTAKQVPGPM